MPDWSTIRLVVFDVDGTLYSQRAIRTAMAIQLVQACLRQRTLLPMRVVRQYRALREHLGDRETPDFESALLTQTAAATGVGITEVRAMAEEWFERRPLPLLRAARYPHVDTVFAALRARGIAIGVLSDYPAAAKLDALGLAADVVAWAGQSEIGVLKPDPRGLAWLMHRAGVEPAQTLMIGDRDDRDGEIARRLGVRAWIRSSRPLPDRDWFKTFDTGPFASLHTEPGE